MPNHDLPQRNRPPRLLNLMHSPDSTRAISNLNEQKSPLLKFPPEIRSRIFKYAMGGNTLHINYHQRVFMTRLCQHPSDYDKVDYRLVMDQHSNVRDDIDGHAPKHGTCLSPSCKSEAGSKISLNLLLTCRLFYHEACLLPFKYNRFVFDARDTIEGVDILHLFFKHYINNTQVRAMAEVIFDGYRIDRLRSPEVKAYAMMKGLQKTGYIIYRKTQTHHVEELWPTIAGPLTDNIGLLTFFGNVIKRALAEKNHSIDLKYMVECWERQQEFFRSDPFAPSQQASNLGE